MSGNLVLDDRLADQEIHYTAGSPTSPTAPEEKEHRVRVITAGTPEPYALRLVAHASNGPRLGTLPHCLGFEAGCPLNDVPSLRLTYPAGGIGAG
ncbi:hypothetical protein [Nonomuraea sp. NPDC048826]|uniref:hypothetical protein n=1 Tax=Nonomuraea sp. NPDC048826 TaxID=3364347 RepID=UPI00372345BC